MLSIVVSLILLGSVLWGQTLPVGESIHYVRPGDNPQAALDAAQAGDKIVFLPGLHEHPLRKHQSILYVDKSIDIELMEGTVLKLASSETLHAADGGLIHIAESSTVSYRVLATARSQVGSVQAGFEAKGLARREAAGSVALFGDTVSTIYSSQPGLRFGPSLTRKAERSSFERLDWPQRRCAGSLKWS